MSLLFLSNQAICVIHGSQGGTSFGVGCFISNSVIGREGLYNADCIYAYIGRVNARTPGMSGSSYSWALFS